MPYLVCCCYLHFDQDKGSTNKIKLLLPRELIQIVTFTRLQILWSIFRPGDWEIFFWTTFLHKPLQIAVEISLSLTKTFVSLENHFNLLNFWKRISYVYYSILCFLVLRKCNCTTFSILLCRSFFLHVSIYIFGIIYCFDDQYLLNDEKRLTYSFVKH